jgi:hypothetical protein
LASVVTAKSIKLAADESDERRFQKNPGCEVNTCEQEGAFLTALLAEESEEECLRDILMPDRRPRFEGAGNVPTLRRTSVRVQLRE